MTSLKTLIFLLLSLTCFAQKKWAGGDSGKWNDPLNWIPQSIPSITDDVALDNLIQHGTYTVTLPDSSVAIQSLVIHPESGKTISLIIPSTSLASPALILTSPGDAIVIEDGGVLLNSSGLTSGQSINSSGTIRINNGGKYIHNTKSAHANDIVSKLSVVPGTEGGIFEFDIPAASTTISLSNRNYGLLKLSSRSNGASVAYSGSGVNALTIGSDLEIGEGVNFSISFSNSVLVKRNLIQKGGVFNLANAAANTVLDIGGDLLQYGGSITKSGTAIPRILLHGSLPQNVLLTGGIHGDIICTINNPSGIVLKSPLLLSYRLELLKGKITSTPGNPVSLLATCTILADSNSNSFVEGPLKKSGLNATPHFLFPVGNGLVQRWLALKNATGNFTVSFENTNPYHISSQLGAGLDHLSSLESWSVEAENPSASSAGIEISFDNIYSGGVTDLNTLRVALSENATNWLNLGNTGFKGTAGASGSVTGIPVLSFNANKNFLTLGSSVSSQNTLPLEQVSFNAGRKTSGILFTWEISEGLDADYFIIEHSATGEGFFPVEMIQAEPNRLKYSFNSSSNITADKFYRLTVMRKNGTRLISHTIVINKTGGESLIVFPTVVINEAFIQFNAERYGTVQVTVSNMLGATISKRSETVIKGKNILHLYFDAMHPGVYLLTVGSGKEMKTVSFIKQ